MGEVKFMPSGDRAMVVEFGNAIDTRINDQVHTLARRIEEEQIPGIVELVPTFRSLMVYYDPFLTSYAKLKAVLENSGEMGAGSGERRKNLKFLLLWARFGQDLADMEAYTGLDRDEIIAIHSSVDYKFSMMGFLPGFVYLGGLDKRIEIPRLKTPRVKIQPGAVGSGEIKQVCIRWHRREAGV